MDQLSFDLNDDIQKYTHIVDKMRKQCGTNQSVCIFTHFTTKGPIYYIGTRTFVYETEYTYDHKISYEVAKYLVCEYGVQELYNHIRNRVISESAQNQINYASAKYLQSINTPLKCDICGKFISVDAFRRGFAKITLITPDSYFTKEKYEILCEKCK